MKNGKHGIEKKHGISKVQSILVSKSLYPTEEKARDYVKRMGYDDSYKLHPDSTLHYFRFRQFKPQKNAQYITKDIDGSENKAVVDLTKGQGETRSERVDKDGISTRYTKESKKADRGMFASGKSYMKFTKASDTMQKAHGKVEKPDNYRIDGNHHIGGQGD